MTPSSEIRKASPNCIRFVYEAIRGSKNQQVTTDRLIRTLRDNLKYSNERASEITANAIHDRIVIPVINTPGGSLRVRGTKNLRLPELSEIQSAHHDWYCFECHLPGALVLCSQCPRSFHRLCYRKDPERPNYRIPSAKIQKNRLPVFGLSSDSDSSNDGSVENSEDFGIEIKTPTSQLQLYTPIENNQSISVVSSEFGETPHDGVMDSPSSLIPETCLDRKSSASTLDTKTKIEVVCIGEVRPPNRRRKSKITYKKEAIIVDDNDDDDAVLQLCTCCRLMKEAALHNPPNLESDELCHLINFTYERNKSWVDDNVFSTLNSLNQTDAVLSKLCLIIQMTDLNIEEKIKKCTYKYLVEFVIDILTLQHNIGVYFGNNSNELESTKWLVRDISHDLAEIRRCPDCFRYSHDKTSIGWFCKPCVQRHELVFAKTGGFSYWPAKVVRVLPNNKYDVRFFGGDHSRALIDVKNIRPIDTDVKHLKIGKSATIKKAMEELHHHQVLMQYPPSQFSYRANKNETDAILSSVLGRNVASAATERRNISYINHKLNQEHYLSEMTCQSTKQQQFTRKRKIASDSSETSKRMTRSSNIIAVNVKKIQNDCDIAQKLVEFKEKQIKKLKSQNQILKDTIKKQDLETQILKRKQWCYWCLKEAIYLCCFKASYCSRDCQVRHWKDGHNKACKNKESEVP